MELIVTRARKIFSDGKHNAFTGIARFGDRVFISFRTGPNHVDPRSTVRVIASQDLNAWSVVTDQGTVADDIDNRDPKVVAFGARLFLYFPECRILQHKPLRRKIRGMVSYSEDGATFTDPRPVRGLPDGIWTWWLRAWEGRLFGSGYSNEGDRRVIAASGDGIDWETLCDLPVEGGNECSFDFDPDGTLWALVREDRWGHIPTLCKLKPPYREVEHRFRLPMRLQGPMLKRLPGGSVIICRQWESPRGLRRNRRCDVFWLADGEPVQYVTTLPSGGDTSYACWLDVGPQEAFVSYYSSHEHRIAVRPDHPGLKTDTGYAEHSTPADIFLADVVHIP